MIKYFLILFFFIQCQGQKKETIFSEWVQLTVKNKDSIIFNPCTGENRKIIIRNDSLIDFTGQEIIACKIKNSFVKKNLNYIVLEKGSSYSDTIYYKTLTPSLTEWRLYNGIKFLSVSSKHQKKYQSVDEKCNNENEIVPKNEYDKLLLSTFFKEFSKDNIKNENAVKKLSSIINYYSNQEDFATANFYNREIKKNKNLPDQQELTTWNLCNQYLDFSDVCSENSLESDWRYPYYKIKSVKTIYNLYKDRSFGDSFESETLKYHIALYMYFLSWNERKMIYEEIDNLKKNLFRF